MSREDEIIKEIELLSKPGGKDGRGRNHVLRIEAIMHLVRELITLRKSQPK
jgi:hypothetical protein